MREKDSPVRSITFCADLINFNEAVAKFQIGGKEFYIYNKKDIPNRFVRLMQKRILGITWRRVH